MVGLGGFIKGYISFIKFKVIIIICLFWVFYVRVLIGKEKFDDIYGIID